MSDEQTPTMPSAAEVKATLEGIGKTVADLRKVNDELQAKAKAGEGGQAELKAQLEKINSALDKQAEVKARLDQIEAYVKRIPTGSGEAKAQDKPEVAEYKAAVETFIRKGDFPGGRHALLALQKKALVVNDEPSGGYFVTPDMSGRMVEFVRETSPLRLLASVQSISSDALEGFLDDDESTTGAAWEEETTTATTTATPKVGKWSIPVHYMRARPLASQKMLDDASINVESWLTAKVGRMFGYLEGAAFVTGNGAGQPRGFTTYTHSASYARDKIQQLDISTTGAITGDGLIGLVYALKGMYRQRATVVANRSTWGKIRLIKESTTGNYLWQPGLTLGQPDRLLGLPTMELADMADVGSNALAVAVADWREAYQIVDRDGFTVMRDPYTADPYVKFSCRRRVGGGVINTDAIKIGKIGTP